MRFIFFVFKEYPGFRGTVVEKNLRRCGAEVYVSGRGVDFVVVRVDDQRIRQCVEKALEMADIDYFEMEGVPKVLRYKLPWGVTRAEVEFK
jgi:hypothetical protein